MPYGQAGPGDVCPNLTLVSHFLIASKLCTGRLLDIVQRWSSISASGLGMAGALSAAPAPKKTVPNWLRAEMLKRGINLNASGGTVSSQPGADGQQ